MRSYSKLGIIKFLLIFPVVGEYRDSECIIMQVQFKTGQTEALSTLILDLSNLK